MGTFSFSPSHSILLPLELIQYICLAGTPATRENSGISVVTTAPAATKADCPMLFPHTIVAFAPIDAPFTIVLLYSSFLSTEDLGLITFVKTILGPQKHHLQEQLDHKQIHCFVS